jgi:hypothetical protein
MPLEVFNSLKNEAEIARLVKGEGINTVRNSTIESSGYQRHKFNLTETASVETLQRLITTEGNQSNINNNRILNGHETLMRGIINELIAMHQQPSWVLQNIDNPDEVKVEEVEPIEVTNAKNLIEQFACPYTPCNYTFGSKDSLNRHVHNTNILCGRECVPGTVVCYASLMIIRSCKENNPQFKCNIENCTKTTTEKGDMHEHFAKDHSNININIPQEPQNYIRIRQPRKTYRV